MIYRRRRPKLATKREPGRESASAAPLDAQREQNAQALAAMVKAERKPVKRRTRGAKLLADVDRFRESGKWEGATPAHLVALYCQLHEWCYGVPVTDELAGKAWLAARSAAEKLVRETFHGSISAAAEFMRWVWKREHGREQWRREQGAPGQRITWIFQFARRNLVTDYRIDQERRQSAPAKP